jgi:hypothetical protein
MPASLFLQLLFFPAFLLSQTLCMQHKIHLETFSTDCAEIVWLCMVKTFGLENTVELKYKDGLKLQMTRHAGG